MRLAVSAGQAIYEAFWDAENTPTLVAAFDASPGQPVTVDKLVAVVTSRDTDHPVEAATGQAQSIAGFRPPWKPAIAAGRRVERTDVLIEGDDEAQISIRFNLFQLWRRPARMTG